MKDAPIAVLLMAYGSPVALDAASVRAYLLHIMQHYRRTVPTTEAVHNLLDRYRTIGGSPLYRITGDLAQALQARLEVTHPHRYRVYWAMKHSPPYIEEKVDEIATRGHTRGIALPLAPFPSRLTTGGYRHAVESANQKMARPLAWTFIEGLFRHPRFLRMWQERIRGAHQMTGRDLTVIFTNHSLPARVKTWDDPYPGAFESTARALAEACGLQSWAWAYQSAGGGREPWLGPDLVEVLEDRVAKGDQKFLIVPIGFLMDHLEVLYDIDLELQEWAQTRGITLRRTPMPNADPDLIELLADLVHENAGS